VRFLRGYGSFTDVSRSSLSIDADAMCYIFFTSGSTGLPKPIAGRFKALGHYIRWEIDAFGLGEEVRVSQLTNFSFDAYLRDVFTPLCAGGVICVPDSSSVAWDPPALVRFLRQAQVNLVHCVPAVLRGLLREGEKGMLGHLRLVLSAGETLFPSDVRHWFEVFPRGVRLVNVYGATETTMTKLSHIVTRDDADRERVPIGRPMDSAEVLVLDDLGQPCPQGVTGEVCIRTPYASLGYFRQPELTRESFVGDPADSAADEVLYHTKDLGRELPDGTFELVGRIDRQMKIAGVRIEPSDIEANLVATGDVEEAAVADFEYSSGEKYLHAYIVARGETDPLTLRRKLAERLPGVAVPRGFTFLTELPRTHTGKVDFAALEPPAVPAGASSAKRGSRSCGVEGLLAAVWKEVLGVEDVLQDDDFLALGGDSLTAAMVANRLRVGLGIDVSLRSILELPVFGDLVRFLKLLQRETTP
jgi:amino acid adenylation domain-containing protein